MCSEEDCRIFRGLIIACDTCEDPTYCRLEDALAEVRFLQVPQVVKEDDGFMEEMLEKGL